VGIHHGWVVPPWYPQGACSQYPLHEGQTPRPQLENASYSQVRAGYDNTLNAGRLTVISNLEPRQRLVRYYEVTHPHFRYRLTELAGSGARFAFRLGPVLERSAELRAAIQAELGM
jgi:hypothetical protein